MDRRLVFPIFPRPPAAYDQRYFADLIRALADQVSIIRAPGEGRQTTIVLTNLQNDDVGLEPGTMFEVQGALRVAVLYQSYVRGTSATSAVGTVTVTV
jgi:hypothetical protein